MALPHTINNGDIPDAAAVMANFNHLADGKGVKVDAYAALKTFAALSPSAQFLGWASDLSQLVFYTGNAALGDGGFIIIGGA